MSRGNCSCAILNFAMRKKGTKLFIISIFSLASLLYLILSFSPSFKLSYLNFQIPIIFVFFVLLFIFIFSISGYIMRSKTQGILIGLFAVSYLLLRFIGLTQLFFLILLLIFFIVLEFLFARHR